MRKTTITITDSVILKSFLNQNNDKYMHKKKQSKLHKHQSCIKSQYKLYLIGECNSNCGSLVSIRLFMNLIKHCYCTKSSGNAKKDSRRDGLLIKHESVLEYLLTFCKF